MNILELIAHQVFCRLKPGHPEYCLWSDLYHNLKHDESCAAVLNDIFNRTMRANAPNYYKPSNTWRQELDRQVMHGEIDSDYWRQMIKFTHMMK